MSLTKKTIHFFQTTQFNNNNNST